VSFQKSKNPRGLSPSSRHAGSSASLPKAPTPANKKRPAAATESDSLTRAKQAAFLAAYEQVGNVTHAARLANVHRATHYGWLEEDPKYPKLFEDAQAVACDNVRQHVRQIALEGWYEPVVYQGKIQFVEELDAKGKVKRGKDGKPIAHPVVIRRRSDRILELLAKAVCPEFRDRHELTTPDGKPLQLTIVTGVPQPEN